MPASRTFAPSLHHTGPSPSQTRSGVQIKVEPLGAASRASCDPPAIEQDVRQSKKAAAERINYTATPPRRSPTVPQLKRPATAQLPTTASPQSSLSDLWLRSADPCNRRQPPRLTATVGGLPRTSVSPKRQRAASLAKALPENRTNSFWPGQLRLWLVSNPAIKRRQYLREQTHLNGCAFSRRSRTTFPWLQRFLSAHRNRDTTETSRAEYHTQNRRRGRPLRTRLP
jgi:hypothetical protein